MTSYRLEDYDFVSLSKHAKKRGIHERLFVGKPVVKMCMENFFAKGLDGLEDKPRSGRAAIHHKYLIAPIEASHESDSRGLLDRLGHCQLN